MREFSDFEKRIICRILESDNKLSLNVLGNILSNTFARYGEYYIKIDSESACYIQLLDNYFKSIEQSADSLTIIRNIIEVTSKDIFLAVKLIEYLEKNDLLFSSGEENVLSIGPVIVDANYIQGPLFDKEVCELLYKYSRKKFISTETLRRLKKNNFLSDEEVRHLELVKQYNKTVKYSAIGICVSLFAVFISVIFAWYVPITTITTVKGSSQPLAIEVDPKLLSDINQKLEEINRSLKIQESHKQGVPSGSRPRSARR